MCTLAIYFQLSAEFPVVVAANRDEFYGRAAAPPATLQHNPWIVAGQDGVAGGTWLGVNAHDVVVGILNRRTVPPPDPMRRSRGVLCLETLRQAAGDAASAFVCAEPGARYNPFNLLIASPRAACFVGNISGAMVPTHLQPGLHLLTNLDLNDMECPRIAKSYGMFDAASEHLQRGAIDRLVPALRDILSEHSTPLDPRAGTLPNNLCVHTERFGTRSSSVLVYAARTRQFRMWHADGPPCRTPYAEIALPYANRRWPPVQDG